MRLRSRMRSRSRLDRDWIEIEFEVEIEVFTLEAMRGVRATRFRNISGNVANALHVNIVSITFCSNAVAVIVTLCK